MYNTVLNSVSLGPFIYNDFNNIIYNSETITQRLKEEHEVLKMFFVTLSVAAYILIAFSLNRTP